MKSNTPSAPHLGAELTALSADGVDCRKFEDYVREKFFPVGRPIGGPEAGTLAIRVSTPIDISTKEIDRLLEGVNTLVKHKA